MEGRGMKWEVLLLLVLLGMSGVLAVDYSTPSDVYSDFNYSYVSDVRSGPTDSSGDYNFSFLAPSVLGVYEIFVNATYGFFETTSEVVDLTVNDEVAPVVSLNSPVDSYNTSENEEVWFDCNASDNYDLANVSLWLDGVLNETNSSGLNNSAYLFSKNLSFGSHEWTCEVCDVNGSCSFNGTNRTVNILGMNLTMDLDDNPVEALQTVYVSGHVNLTDGTDVGDSYMEIYVNGSELNGYQFTDSSGDYNVSFSAPSVLGTYPVSVNMTVFSGKSFYKDGYVIEEVYFSPDGLNLFMPRAGSIEWFVLDEAWDVTSVDASSEVSFRATEGEGNIGGIFFSSDGLRMFLTDTIVSDNVYQYNLTEAWNISTASHSGESYYVGAEDSGSQDIAFSSDGYKMFILGYSTNTLYQYNLTEAWNVSSASYSGENFSAGLFMGTGFSFSSDGDMLFVLGRYDGKVHQYNLTEAWNISSMSYVGGSDDIRDSIAGVRGLAVSSDGSSVFVSAYEGDRINEYTLARDWDITSLSFGYYEASEGVDLVVSDGFDPVVSLNSPVDSYNTSENEEVLFSCNASDNYEIANVSLWVDGILNQTNSSGANGTIYLLNTSLEFGSHEWTCSICDSSGACSFASENRTVNILGMNLTMALDDNPVEAGQTIYVSGHVNLTDGTDVGNSYMEIYVNGSELTGSQFTDGSGDYNVSFSAPGLLGTYPVIVNMTSFSGNSFYTGGEDINSGDLAFSTDGTKAFIVGTTSDTIYAYNLTEAWSISSATYSGESFYVGTWEDTSGGLAFSTDGTKAFIVGASSDTIYAYNLTEAWSISSATYSGESFYVGTWEEQPRGLAFSTDGTKAFIVGIISDIIYAYNLTEAWNISSATYSGESFDTGIGGAPTGLIFSTDGTRAFTIDYGTDTIYAHNLTEAWNLSTATYTGKSLYIGSWEILASGISVSPDGTKVFSTGSISDRIQEYDLARAWDLSSIGSGYYEATSDEVSLVVSDEVSPAVSLNSPVDDYNVTFGDTTEFSCLVSDNYEVENVSLVLDGVLNETNSSGLNNSYYNFEKILGLGNHDWSCLVCDSSGGCVDSGNRSLGVLELNVSVVTPNVVNTTDVVSVNGTILEFNGSDYYGVPNTPYLIRVNGTAVSDSVLEYSDFSNGALLDVDVGSGDVRLNFSEVSDMVSYSDDFSTTGYLSDAYGYYDEAYSSGTLFELDQFASGLVGNVTYLFSSETGFYNATVYATTDAAPTDAGGNTSVWFSLDGSSWSLVGASTSSGATIGGEVVVDSETGFYVKLESDATGYVENPVTYFEVNYTEYSYTSNGSYISEVLNFSGVSLVGMSWEDSLNGGYLSLDGDGDYVEYSSIDVGDEITLSIWVNRTGGTLWGVPLIEQGGSRSFRLVRADEAFCYGNDTNVDNFYCTESIFSSTNTWYHVVVVSGASGNRMWVNGVEYTLTADAGQYGSWSTDQLNIGYRPYSVAVGGFNGLIDNVMILNRSLSDAEVGVLNGYSRRYNDYNDESLVSKWSFDYNANDSVGSNDGNLVGDAEVVNLSTSVEVQVRDGDWESENGVLSLDGNGDYVKAADDGQFNTSDSFTWSVWYYKQASATSVELLNKFDGYGDVGGPNIYFQATGKISYYLRNGTFYELESDNLWDVGVWHHVLVNYDSSTGEGRFYHDGSLVGSEIVLNAQDSSTEDFTIGKRSYHDSGYFDGYIDNVMVFNRSLSAVEANDLYEIGRASDYIDDSLVSRWSFDSDFSDSTGSNNGSGFGDAAILSEPYGNLSWSVFVGYLDATGNDLTSYGGDYLQFRALLNSNNSSVTPILSSVNFSYFNDTTDSGGDYAYDLTVPTSYLGIVNVTVELAKNYLSGILGVGSSLMEVWVETSLGYSSSGDYSGAETNYSVVLNWTRDDLGSGISGGFNVTIWNSTFSDMKQCSGVGCSVSWGVPSELASGSYDLNLSISNNSAYYRAAENNSNSVSLEETDTTGSLYAWNKTVTDYSYGSYYRFFTNVSVTNTGEASMHDISVYDYYAQSGIENVSKYSGCDGDLGVGEVCNATMEVYLSDVVSAGEYLISWRANWTDNDGAVSNYIAYTGMRVIVVGNPVMELSTYAEELTLQHNRTDYFDFYINSTGSDPLTNVDLDYIEGNLSVGDYNLSSSWVSVLTSYPIGVIPADSSNLINVSVSIPVQTSPGNYSGSFNMTSNEGESQILNVTVTVPVNGSWYLVPSSNFTYSTSISLDTASEIANYTLTNIGNVDLNFSVSYLPSGDTDYSAFPGLITENYDLSGEIVNPTSFNVSKGSNDTIILYQNGWSSALSNIGIITTFSNASGSPSVLAIEDNFTIEEQPPAITGVWFILDGEYGEIAEEDKDLVMKFRATDDVALNVSGAVFNISWGGGSTQVAATANTTYGEYEQSGADYIVLNYTGVYAPTTAGVYTVSATVSDESGNSYSSGEYNFTSYGETTLNFSQNISSGSVSNVDLNNKGYIYVNYTINNSGLVTGYLPTLKFAGNENISINNYTFGNLSGGSLDSHVVQMNVSELTPAGDYNVSVSLEWTDPDGGSASSASQIFVITVEENKSIIYSPSSISKNVNSASSNWSLLEVNNTGNAVLSGLSVSCESGDLCSTLSVAANESSFDIGVNSSRVLNLTINAPAGTPAGSYSGVLNISGDGVSESLNIYSTVPTSKTWNVSDSSLAYARAAGGSGDLQEIVLNNTGNVNMTWNFASTNSSIVGTNVSSLEVPLGESRLFVVNYTLPDGEAQYYETISVTNTDGGASPVQSNISVNLNATILSVSIIYPSASNVLGDVEAGDNITVSANATYGEENVTSSSSWAILVGGVSCSLNDYSYDVSTNAWNVSCVAPSLSDGVTYNVSAVLTHDVYGVIDSTESAAVEYLDVSVPKFDFVRGNVGLGDNIDVSVNVSDNVAVDSVSGVLFYPNSSNISLGLTSSGGYYVNDSFALDVAGEYVVNVSANDTAGNFNYSNDWFEVQNNYSWILNLTDYAGSGVNATQVKLFRPNTDLVLNNGTTDENGDLSLVANQRFYDLFVNLSGDTARVYNVNFTNWTTSNISFNVYRMGGEDLNEVVLNHRPFMGLAVNSSGMSSNTVQMSFGYYGFGYNYDDLTALDIVKCNSWNYSDRSCLGSWSALTSSRDVDTKRIEANSTGFSAYFLSENKCGNGACEATYGETTATCSADCTTTTTDTTTTTGGGGGGGGGGSSSNIDTQDLERLLESYLDVGGAVLETSMIEKSLYPGEVTTATIRLKNTLDEATAVAVSATGEAASFIFFESNSYMFEAGETREIIMKIIAPEFAKVGEYSGSLLVESGEDSGEIGLIVDILSPEGKLLDVKIQPLTESVAPGEILRLQTDLLNLGQSKRVDVQFDLQLIDLYSGEIVTRAEEAFAVETSISTVKNLTIPDYVEPARYMVKGVAYYSNAELEGTMQASSIAYVNVQYPFFERQVFGVYLWIYLLLLLLVGLGIGGFYYFRWLELRNKRFKGKLDLNKLPRPGKNSGYVGRVAETDNKAYTDLNKLQMHTLIAGSTGSGKTVAAQDIIEEALLKKKSVVVFDPTAQWSGFLRKCEDASMLKRYKYFGMSTKQAQAFSGAVKIIRDPYEVIDLKKHMNNPGEIMIFDVSRLSPKEIDVVVASTIEQVFRAAPEESKDLKALVVYDEVHRLLPKFGGSGKGFVQIERGAREFRKWGIGLVLISQVLSDFVGEIKANIGTEIQMGTRYEGDLQRISMKYGDEVLKSVAKEPIGTGMNLNAEYNNGIPYFVSYRPMLHSTKRLTKAELDKYEKYFNEVEDLEYQVGELKKLNVDTTDVELELRLASTKIKQGKFMMAETYLETLRPKFEATWKGLGKPQVHRVAMRLTEAALDAGVSEAQKGRKSFEDKNPVKQVSLDEDVLKLSEEVEAKKKSGVDTSSIEISLQNLKDRLKPFNGKVDEASAASIKMELNDIKTNLSKLGPAQ